MSDCCFLWYRQPAGTAKPSEDRLTERRKKLQLEELWSISKEEEKNTPSPAAVAAAAVTEPENSSEMKNPSLGS